MPRLTLSVCLLLAGCVPAARCFAEGECQSSEPRTYQATAGDKANSTSFEAGRHLPAALEKLAINICSGDVLVRRASSGDQLRVVVSSPGADRSLAEYVRSFSVDGGRVLLSVQVPAKYHPTVTLLIPHLGEPSTEVNLGKGKLLLGPSLLGQGSRRLNVGAGKVTLLIDRASYATLAVNIGMGELNDELPGGSNAHFAVSRQTSGTGKGALEVNVGAGMVVLSPGEE